MHDVVQAVIFRRERASMSCTIYLPSFRNCVAEISKPSRRICSTLAFVADERSTCRSSNQILKSLSVMNANRGFSEVSYPVPVAMSAIFTVLVIGILGCIRNPLHTLGTCISYAGNLIYKS